VTPTVNQIELHPHLSQPELRRLHGELGIATEAWSPLARGDVLADTAIADVAKRAGRTAAQVVLRWHLQIGNIVIPKSVTPERIRENIDVFDFALSAEDVAMIEGLDRGERIGPDPDNFERP
jgi:diketogulonate reductase-like aldo/keto reductase